MKVQEATVPRTERVMAKGWIQAVVLVSIFGFTVLGFMAARTYQAEPPIPDRVVTSSGTPLFSGNDVRAGQDVFLRNGLMQYGSIFGHGGYLGPDFTADYLHRAAVSVERTYGGELDARQRTSRRLPDQHLRRRHRDPRSTPTPRRRPSRPWPGTTTTSSPIPAGDTGLRPSAITDPDDTRHLTAYFSWSAWVAAAERPGKDYSYTNNWPPEELVANTPSPDVVVWSVLSLVALLTGIGALLAVFGRWNWLGWHGRDQHELSFRSPDRVALTPSQKATAGFFLVMGRLFLVQSLVGVASQHYRAEIGGFFGIDTDRFLPFNIVRTWHVQLSIFWVVSSFLAVGIFLTPMIAGHREPKGQSVLTQLLLGALVVVVVGSLLGELGGIHGWFGGLWSWFGMQGFEYLDLGRFWQILLTVGLSFWVVILYRGLRSRLRVEHRTNMPWLFFYAALALPAFYAVGLLAHPRASFAVADFWRFIVVHLWVEDFLELFTTVMVAYLFVLLGVVRQRVAMTVIFLDIILYSSGGVIGMAHHLYFNGEPAEVLALGAFFSALEVIPLTFLTLEAWSFLQLGIRQESKSSTPFPHKWAVMFLVAVGFWNFLGAGVFGFLINLPIVSYYEIGTALTANHSHAAMMGVYGMLAVGFMLFCLRYLLPEDKWSDKAAKISFWSLNIGLAWMCFVTLLPLGIVQLYRSVGQRLLGRPRAQLPHQRPQRPPGLAAAAG